MLWKGGVYSVCESADFMAETPPQRIGPENYPRGAFRRALSP